MHIAINCHSFSKAQFTGIGRYASSLVEFLSQIDSVNEYSLYTTRGAGQIKERVSLNGATNFLVRLDWLKKGIGKTIKCPHIYHAPAPESVPHWDAKLVVTVHDLIYKTYPQGHTEETLALSEQHFQSFASKAAKIICSSQNTQNDLHKYFPQTEGKTCYIHQGVNKGIFYPLAEERKGQAREVLAKNGIRDPFLLFVGTIEPRKNLKGLLEAFARLKQKKLFDGKLVVIGMAGWKTEGIKELIEKLGINGDVVFLGFVSNDDLRVFYNLAEVFIFPSFYEGFGYPIVEAFSCGAAVVTSNISSCPEIAGEAALTADPNDPEAIAMTIARILQYPALKESLRRKALERAGEFDNLKTARETLRVYNEIYQNNQ